MTPPARSLHLHRRDLTNVLIVGGSAEERLRVAYEFHRESALRKGPFICLDTRHEQYILRSALQRRVSSADVEPGSDPIRDSERGTLFLDSIESLSRDTQRMFLSFVRHNSDVSLEESEGAWLGRLAVGSSGSLAPSVREGRFMAALYDSLDKVRVDLPLRVRGVA